MKKIRIVCGYCGSPSHDRRDCPRELKETGRWTLAQWTALNRLCELERDCMMHGLHITACPAAVRQYDVLGHMLTPKP